jgi:uncharacterized protein YndB with AHSA1/START domain/rhodanese-related sulfurtransferase
MAPDLRRLTRSIGAPAQDVWAALTDPAMLRDWLGEVSPRYEVGKLSRLDPGDGDRYALEIFAMEPPHRLSHGRRRFDIDVKERISWDIAEHKDGSLVTVSYSAPELDDDARSAQHSEWLFHTRRLEKYLAAEPLPPIPPDREFLLSIDLPGDAAAIKAPLDAFLDKSLGTTLSLSEEGEITITSASEPDGLSIALELDHPRWHSPMPAWITLRQRSQGTRLTIRHRGWEGAASDDETRLRLRRRFARFWHLLLLRFTLGYARSWQIPTLSAVEVRERMERPGLIVLDANRVTLWERGHVPQAVFVGQEDIPSGRLPDDRDTDLVFYCRDTMCLTAYLTAAQARTLGYEHTFVMKGGRQAWAESGFPLIAENGAEVLSPEQGA